MPRVLPHSSAQEISIPQWSMRSPNKLVGRPKQSNHKAQRAAPCRPVLRNFCDVVVSGRCAIRAMGFIKLDQPVAKLAVMHVGCEGCRSVLNQYCSWTLNRSIHMLAFELHFEELFGPTGFFASVVQTCFLLNTVGNDDEELRGFRECGPTARLGTYNHDENLNIKVPGAGCVQLKMRFHRFPLVSPKLDTPSKISFSVETLDFKLTCACVSFALLCVFNFQKLACMPWQRIDGDTFDFEELELKPRPPNTQAHRWLGAA